MATLHFGLLGPVTAHHADVPVPLGPPQRRAVLAALLLPPGQALTVAALRGRVWPGPPPASAISAIHLHIHHLRRALAPYDGPDDEHPVRLTTHPGHSPETVSYLFHIAPGQIDADRFRRLADDGADRQARGDHHGALDHFDAALALWRGEPLTGLRPSAFVRTTRRTLTEIHLDTGRRRAAALLATGAVSRATHALQELHDRHPDDESTVVALARALCAAGVESRAARLLGEELERRHRTDGVRPPALARARATLLSGTTDQRDGS
ncbi:AfsR/SARP family transcriptional regulator [Streptomyces monomycini]|uniref:AfsR/SARP family transcriptional regulator n=1 Tax=Streptomyces monomycini TaxID=371720 RepID=UPI000D129CE7|nr:BTAD domain-containing putative transcriptional regulator [Streptomyces monomycini]